MLLLFPHFIIISNLKAIIPSIFISENPHVVYKSIVFLPISSSFSILNWHIMQGCNAVNFILQTLHFNKSPLMFFSNITILFILLVIFYFLLFLSICFLKSPNK